jgi:hypothetical protein
MSDSLSAICYDNIDEYDKDSVKTTINIINSIGLNHVNYNIFNVNDNKNLNIAIPLFKLLWHFQIYKIIDDKIITFFNAVINSHYIESALNSELISKYFDNLITLSNQEGVLIISKEASGDQGTLKFMYDNWGIRSGTKNLLCKSFDAKDLEQKIEVNKCGKFNYREKLISKIIFITDNIMGGTATIQMLDFHISNKKVDKNKHFVEIDSEKNVSKIIKANDNVEIEVHSIFGYEDGKDKIKQKYTDIEVVFHNIIESKFISDRKMQKDIKLLYNYNIREGIRCMMRCNNMPNTFVFPNNVVNTEYLGGIFNRKEELPK